MRFSGGFLRTTVGRRLFTRFLLAAFIPAMLTAVIAASFVRSEVRGAIELKVGRSARLVGMNTLATLGRLDVAFQQATRTEVAQSGASRGLFPAGFSSIETRPLVQGVPGVEGRVERELSEAEQNHLASGRTLIVVGTGAPLALRMATLDRSGGGPDLVHWARIEDRVIWGSISEALLDEQSQLCIVELSVDRLLMCEEPVPTEAQRALGAIRGTGQVGLASWKDGEIRMHAASWNVFLRFAYGAPDWRVMVIQTSDATFGSLRGFTLTFSGILLLSLLVVILLSHAQIRRSTEPLEQLQAGTQRLEAGDFTTQVNVESRDEYSTLADSFNRMAMTLDRQIVTLRGLDELHQSVLGARDFRPLLETALGRIGTLVRDADLLVAVEHAEGEMEALLMTAGSSLVARVSVRLSTEERNELVVAPGVLGLPQGNRHGFLDGLFIGGALQTHIVPFVYERRLLGFVAIGCSVGRPPGSEQLDGVRRLADRITLAVADVQNVRHLAALSSGTMTAFARAIEANSRWTAGHSERVTAMALRIGERMGLAKQELAILQRGGLLHDIGKIGIPTAVLDKPGPLTSAERRLIEQHTVVGAEILSPIGAFIDAIPIVRSHHEQWSGGGYPDGLAGTDIPYLARILAVADVFDAMVSDRPYRASLSPTQAAGFIEIGSGRHFDPEPAAAFLDAFRSGSMAPVLSTSEWGHRFGTMALEMKAVEDAA